MIKILLGLIFTFFISVFSFAQTTFTGVVYDNNQIPLPGASVMVKGTNIGVTTDFEGNFSIKIPEDNKIIEVTYLGYLPFELDVTSKTEAVIIMTPDAAQLDDVVVTALGITRDEKSLGYATQEIDGNDINEARETNFVNSLQGKIAGVNITSSGAVGSSSRIVIRGESSLNFQRNTPLYIVDGVPIGDTGTSNSNAADYGNGSAEINPADIESISVLKGATASALYGARGANGVILITTKSGKDKKGMGVAFTSGFTVESMLRLPKFQNQFGQGSAGNYEGSNFGASSSMYADGVSDGYDESWGPRMNVGTLEAQFSSPTLGGMRGGDVYNPNRGEVIPTPWIGQPDNIKDFFDTGETYYNNISLSGSNDKGTYRLSYSNLDQKGVIPNNNLERNTFALKSSYNLTNKLRADVVANYVLTSSTNRPETGYGRNSIMYFMTWMTRNVDINSLRNYWQTGLEGQNQFQYNYGENHNNPFFYQYENTRGQDKKRLFGNIALTYDFNEHLSLRGRVGTDYANDFRPMRWAVSTVGYEQGRYYEESRNFEETNYDVLLSYNNSLMDGKFTYNLSAGGNVMNQKSRFSSADAPQLSIPGLYTIANSAVSVIANSGVSEKEVQSLYAFANLSYDDKFYLDITGRNDWSSTLPSSDWSYFYPSASLSTLVHNLVQMPEWLSFAKLRMGLAGVGNDTNVSNLLTTFNFANSWDGNIALTGSDSLKNPELKPERTTSYELGADVRFFNNRLGVDITYYNNRTKNQIINLDLAASTSYGTRVINAGEIENSGWEVMLNATPVQSKNFQWSALVNFSTNKGKLLSLYGDIDQIVQQAPGEDAAIIAKVGGEMGAIWGPGYQRVEEGPMKGEIIIFEDGRPKATTEDIYLGNLNPDWIGSLSNTFTYKNVSLTALIDIHYGGKFISRFYNKAMGAGQLKETLKGRAARPVGQEYDAPYYIEGAALVNGSYVANATSTDGTYSEGIYGTDARYFHKAIDHISEAQLFDATYAKLREVRLGYTFPKKWFNGYLQDVKLSLVARNLFLWTPDSNQHFDPEVATATSGSGLVPGFENMSLPSTRSFGVNLNVKF